MALRPQRDAPTGRLPTSGSDQQDFIDGWSEAVRNSTHSLALLELPSTTFVAISPGAERLLGISDEDASRSNYLSMIEPGSQAEQTVRMLGVGDLDSVEARHRVTSAHDSADIHMRAHAVRREGHDSFVLWAAVEDHIDHVDPVAMPPDRALSSPGDDSLRVSGSLLATLDHHWQMTALDTELHSFLGQARDALTGSSILHMTHPADSARLLCAFALATSGVDDSTRIRVRSVEGTFHPVTVTISVLRDPLGGNGLGLSSFAVAFDVDPKSERSGDAERIHVLEQRLLRIGAEVDGAGLSTAYPAAHVSEVTLPEMSDRQHEVVLRLVRGERVLTMAAEMYLSPSTVRNHLSAIFAKFGVHSQRELLDALRPAATPPLAS